MRTLASRPASSGLEADRLTRVLLGCGIVAAVLYLVINVVVPLLDPSHDVMSQTVSELSAIGAPTRTIWMVLGAPFAPLMAAFGWGVLRAAGSSRPLRVVGIILVAYGIFILGWPPMHQRGEPTSLTDTLHIVWMAVSGPMVMLAIVFSAAAFAGRFRWYSIATIVILLVTGWLTSRNADNVQKDLPTPWMGAWERLNILFFMLWLIVFGILMLKRQASNATP